MKKYFLNLFTIVSLIGMIAMCGCNKDKTYIVSFDSNGGSGYMQEQTFTEGEEQALALNEFTKSGYIFKGWNTIADGTGKSYTDGQSIMVITDMTLFAQWKKTFIVRFDPNGGSGSMQEQTFTEGEEQALTRNAFTRSGYIFIGWNIASYGSGTSYDDGQSIMVTADMTLYAQWKKALTVRFDPNGGSGTMQDQAFAEGVEQALERNMFTKAGSTFIGWNTRTNGTGMSYTDGQIISISSNMTLYAQWTSSPTVTFNANGGTGTMAPQIFTAGVQQALTLNSFTRNGYVFEKWNTKANGSGTSYTNGQIISISSSMTLYAQWTENPPDFTASGTIDNHDYVDLGLSVKWATYNVGANSITSSGNYYAWQETTPVSSLTYINYQYNFNPCSPDNILSSIYDAATTNWGRHWRMPTYEEMEELCNNCVWTWVSNFQNSGVSGCIVKSRINNKSIFLPALGYMETNQNQLLQNGVGFYWTSYAGPGNLWEGPLSAVDMTFNYGGTAYGGHSDTKDRSDGLLVRAVVGTPNNYIPEGPFPLDNSQTSLQGFSVSGQKDGKTYVDLGLPSRTLWATCNVGASTPREYGNYYAWGETTPKEVYDETSYVFYDGIHSSGTNQWVRYSKYTWYAEHHGSVDGKLRLDPEDDAATQNMGSNWSMPTKEQIDELIHYVAWRQDGSSGWIGTSKINGYTIYIPNAGWEYNSVPNSHLHAWYWSSDLNEPSPAKSDYYAYQLISHSTSAATGSLEIQDAMRFQGLSVRGVTR